LPLPEILASPPMASATARFMTFATGSFVKRFRFMFFIIGKLIFAILNDLFEDRFKFPATYVLLGTFK
jgi:hypothetical protein